jgi:hypothetical protein
MSEPAAKLRDALRECLEEAIGRDLAAGVTRTALRLASVNEPPTEEDALRLYVEGPLATAVAEALGREAAAALVHIVRARLFDAPTLPPPPRSGPAEKSPALTPGAATTSAIRRSGRRFTVALRCTDALRRSEMARSLVQTQCDVFVVSGIDDVARLRASKALVDLAVVELGGIDSERLVRDICEAFHPPMIALYDGDDTKEAVRVLHAAGVHRFALLKKSASSRELVESVSELLVGFVASK